MIRTLALFLLAGCTFAPPGPPVRELQAQKLGGACAPGSIGSCYEKGLLAFRDGRVNEARVAHHIACEGGLARSCTALGEIEYRWGSFQEGVRLYERACQLGHKAGCWRAKALIP